MRTSTRSRVATLSATLLLGAHMMGCANPDGQPEDSTSGNLIEGSDVRQTIAGNNMGYCAIKSDGSLFCITRILGRAMDHGPLAQTEHRLPGRFRSIVAEPGTQSYCGITVDHDLECFELTDDGKVHRDVKLVPGGDRRPGKFRSVALNRFAACAVRLDGTVDCWGNPSFLGDPAGGAFSDVVGGGYNSFCGLQTDHKIQCWGNGDAHVINPLLERQGKPHPHDFLMIDVSSNYGCGVRLDHSIACWGEYPGTGSAEVAAGSVRTVTVDPPAGTFQSVSVHDDFACGLRTNGKIACWGRHFGDPLDMTYPSRQGGTYASIWTKGYSTGVLAISTVGDWVYLPIMPLAPQDEKFGGKDSHPLAGCRLEGPCLLSAKEHDFAK